MNLFFDEESQKLIINAKKEMFELKHPYVGSEHLFLAILKNTNLEITRVLNDYSINYEKFKKELISIVGIGSKSNEWFLFTPLLKRIISNACYYSKDKSKIVTPYSLLISILQEGDGVANRILLGMNIDIVELSSKFCSSDYFCLNSSTDMLDHIGINMNNMFFDGKFDPVIGRDEQVEELIKVLLRKNKGNPLLIGEAGVGKTAIVEELARRIALGNVPFKLKNKTIYSISMSTLVSGTKYRGEFEEKINKMINEIRKNENIILFIDEVHTLMGAGGAEGAIDAANILKPYLARDDIKIIGATTVNEYKKYIEVDKALNRRFQKIYIEEPTRDSVGDIIFKLKYIYEKYHGVYLSNDLIDKLVDISYDCISFGSQPDKAIDLLDEVCSYAIVQHNDRDKELTLLESSIKNLEIQKNKEIVNHNFKQALYYREEEFKARNDYNNKLFSTNDKNINIIVTLDDLYKVIYNRYRIPLKKDYIVMLDREKGLLKKTIYGQDNIIDSVISCLKKYDFINNKKTLTLLFTGKVGVGKTYMINRLINDLFSNKNLISLNMQDYGDESSLSKLLGTNPGYVGYNDICLFDSIKENPFSLIFLDDIDKCNIKILKLLFDSFNNGYITTSKNEKIMINKCIVFMTSSTSTSNIGFVNGENNETLLSKYYDNINYIFNLNDINEDIISIYLDNNLDKSFNKNKVMKQLLNNYDYRNNGLKMIDKYINI